MREAVVLGIGHEMHERDRGADPDHNKRHIKQDERAGRHGLAKAVARDRTGVNICACADDTTVGQRVVPFGCIVDEQRRRAADAND